MSIGALIRTRLQLSLRLLPFSRNRVPRVNVAFYSMLSSGSLLNGETGRTYRLICPLTTQKAQDAAAVWMAVNDANEAEKYIVKEPSAGDNDVGCPLFQHEHDMQVLFSDSKFIRQMVDYVPSKIGVTPKLVLEAFEKNIWEARLQRPMSKNEIKWIMKAVILALWEVHRKGLVYSDLKMENVLANGFHDKEGDVRSIIVRLADCGAITRPSNREITSITYRSPEIYFSKQWTSSVDIWSWGIMYCHLLEAQADFSSPGLYDSICSGSLQDKANAVRIALSYDFDLHSIPYYTDDQLSQFLLPPQAGSAMGSNRWFEKLSNKGVKQEDIAFLYQILNPDPTERWSAEDIVSCGYLEI